MCPLVTGELFLAPELFVAPRFVTFVHCNMLGTVRNLNIGFVGLLHVAQQQVLSIKLDVLAFGMITGIGCSAFVKAFDMFLQSFGREEVPITDIAAGQKVRCMSQFVLVQSLLGSEFTTTSRQTALILVFIFEFPGTYILSLKCGLFRCTDQSYPPESSKVSSKSLCR
jgi:hypothetical protein